MLLIIGAGIASDRRNASSVTDLLPTDLPRPGFGPADYPAALIPAGSDGLAMLPYLARYMGHASIESTFYYIHTSPEFLRSYDGLTIAGQSLLPEVGFG